EPKVEALIKATRADFRIGGNRAFYMPGADYIQVPPPQVYFETINWHRTALHEISHWSGAPQRLNRDHSGSYGSRTYAFEELVALSGQSGRGLCGQLVTTQSSFCCVRVRLRVPGARDEGPRGGLHPEHRGRVQKIFPVPSVDVHEARARSSSHDHAIG